MIFGVVELVSYISRFMTLLPGDVIATGTPSGEGMGLNPPRYLKAGDVAYRTYDEKTSFSSEVQVGLILGETSAAYVSNNGGIVVSQASWDYWYKLTPKTEL